MLQTVAKSHLEAFLKPWYDESKAIEVPKFEPVSDFSGTMTVNDNVSIT
jgi:hypothetical protein